VPPAAAAAMAAVIGPSRRPSRAGRGLFGFASFAPCAFLSRRPRHRPRPPRPCPEERHEPLSRFGYPGACAPGRPIRPEPVAAAADRPRGWKLPGWVCCGARGGAAARVEAFRPAATA